MRADDLPNKNVRFIAPAHKVKSVFTRAPGSRAACHLTDFNETLPV